MKFSWRRVLTAWAGAVTFTLLALVSFVRNEIQWWHLTVLPVTQFILLALMEWTWPSRSRQ